METFRSKHIKRKDHWTKGGTQFFFFTTLYIASRTWFSRGTLFKPESRNAALTQRFPLVRMSPPGRISCSFLIRLMVSSSNLSSKAFANHLSQSHNYTRTLASIPFLKLFFSRQESLHLLAKRALSWIAPAWLARIFSIICCISCSTCHQLVTSTFFFFRISLTAICFFKTMLFCFCWGGCLISYS